MAVWLEREASGSVAALDAPAVVLDLLRQQSELYGQLERFAVRQRSLVRAEAPGPLLALLAERARLSDRLAQLATRLAPVRAQWSAYRQRLDDRERAEAETLLRNAGDRLRRVIDGDESDARLLAIRKERVRGELAETECVDRALSAYGGSVRRGATTLDEAS